MKLGSKEVSRGILIAAVITWLSLNEDVLFSFSTLYAFLSCIVHVMFVKVFSLSKTNPIHFPQSLEYVTVSVD